MNHDQLMEKDRQHNLQLDLVQIEIETKHANQEKKNHLELFARHQRACERELRNQKRREQLMEVATDAMKQAEALFLKAQDNLNAVPNPEEIHNQVTKLRAKFFGRNRTPFTNTKFSCVLFD